MPVADAPPRRADTVVAEQLDDELCLYQPQTSDVAVLNRTAAEIWALADGDADLARITAQLAGRYGQDADAVAEQVRAVVGDLTARGFLVAG